MFVMLFFSLARSRGSKCALKHTRAHTHTQTQTHNNDLLVDVRGGKDNWKLRFNDWLIQPHTHSSYATRTVTVMGFVWESVIETFFLLLHWLESALVRAAAQFDDVTHAHARNPLDCMLVNSGLNLTLTTFQYGPNLRPFLPPTPPSPGATPLANTPKTSKHIDRSKTSIQSNCKRI